MEEKPTVGEMVLNHYTLSAVIIWIGCLLIVTPDRHWLVTTFGILFMHFWVYFVHRLLHILPRTGIIGFLNTHFKYHHEHIKTIDRRLELFFEAIADLGMNLSLIPIEWAIGFYFVPFSVTVLFAISYTTVHIVNYSLIGNDRHKQHHLLLEKNFAPDPVDHLFGTNSDAGCEDMNPLCFNAMAVVIPFYYLKQWIGWTD